MKRIYICLLALFCLLTSCSVENPSDGLSEIQFFDDLGYIKNNFDYYTLVDISRYTKTELVVPEVLPNGGIVNALDVEDAPNIESLIMSKHVKYIEWDRRYLKHIYIGMTFTDMSQLEGFSGTLESIEVDVANPSYYSEYNCVVERQTETLVLGCKNSVIPDKVWIIGRFAFANSDIAAIEIPNYVARICISAFADCTELKEIFIGENVIRIENSAFYGTPNLIINCEAETKPFGWDDQWVETERIVKLGCKEINWGATPE